MSKIKENCAMIMALLIMMLCIGNSQPVHAAEKTDEQAVVLTTEDMAKYGTIEKHFTDQEGNESTIRIVEIPSKERTSSRTFNVWFNGGAINCNFHMKVSNNKCVSAYDYKIVTVGCTYSNARLTKTSKQAKLSMDITVLKGVAKGNCWLKGTVTGSKNDIKVTYSF